jgi:DNA-binding NarL/FixJ family response regulator
LTHVLVLAADRATGEGLAAALSAAEDVGSAATVRSSDEVLEILARPASEKVHAVVAAANLAGDHAMRLAGEFRGDPDAPWLVITGLSRGDPALVRYLEAGADAYLTDELSLSGLLLVLRLLRRGEMLLGPHTAHQVIRRLHALSDLLDGAGVDLSAMAELTTREREVLDLVADGLSNKDIGTRLYIGVGTVKSHVHAILTKLDVRDRDEARRVLILWRSRMEREASGEE